MQVSQWWLLRHGGSSLRLLATRAVGVRVANAAVPERAKRCKKCPTLNPSPLVLVLLLLSQSRDRSPPETG